MAHYEEEDSIVRRVYQKDALFEYSFYTKKDDLSIIMIKNEDLKDFHYMENS